MVRKIRIGAATLALAAVVLLTLSVSGPRSSVAAAGLNEVPWQSQGWNVSGVNMAWYNWACDFGCGSGSGVSSSSSQAAIGARFANLEQTGVHMVRWWMFQDPWQIQTDGSGKPIGIEPQVYEDIDAALQLAATHDIYYTFVLFEFPRNIPGSWMSNVEHRQALGQVLGELFARYDGNPRVFAWEVFNEPEWDMWNNVVPEQPVVDTAAVVVDAIHANSSALATVGNAMVDGIPYWTEIGLDFYSPHWYDYMQPGGWCAFCRTADSVRTQYGVSAPIVIGEFYAGTDVGGDARYQQWHDLGYAGAWAWSLFPERTADGMTIDLDGLASYASRHTNIGPSSAGSPTTIAGPTLFDEPTEAQSPTEESADPPPTQEPTREPTLAPAEEPVAEPTAEPTPESTALPEDEPVAPPALEPGFTTSASAPGSVTAGASANITLSVTSGTTETVLLDVEVYGADGAKVFQDWVDGAVLEAGVRRSFLFDWAIADDHPEGSYSVVVAVFEPGWVKNLVWDPGAAVINVVAAAPAPAPAPEPARPAEDPSEPLVSSVTVGDGVVSPGTKVDIRTSVFSDAALDILLDIEIYDANGNRVFQVWRDNRTLGADQTKTFRNVWRIPRDLPPGQYTVAIGVFGRGWDGLYDWNPDAGSFTVTQ